jgi:hypothetical protein
VITVDFLLVNIHPFLDKLFFDVLINFLRIGPKDIELWANDPKEYIYAIDCCYDVHIRLKATAKDLIAKICTTNHPNGNLFLFEFINFACSCFDTKINPRTQAAVDPGFQDALLHGFLCLRSQIIKQESILGEMETILTRAVIPLLTTDQNFLKFRACSVFQIFGNIEFDSIENLSAACSGICRCMLNPDLPVKFMATCALQMILVQDNSVDILRGNMKDIMGIILEVMKELDHSDIVACLEYVIGRYNKEIGPFAYDLVDQ